MTFGEQRILAHVERSWEEDMETDAEEAFSNPWDQAFVDLLKSDGISANIDLGLLYE